MYTSELGPRGQRVLAKQEIEFQNVFSFPKDASSNNVYPVLLGCFKMVVFPS